MPRLKPIDFESAPRETKELLDGVKAQLGMLPNIFLTMANSPYVLEGFVGMRRALEKGVLPPKLREQIALTVSETAHSRYCVCGHTAIAKTLGCSDEEIMDARRGTSPDRKVDVVLRFARAVAERPGHVTDDELKRLRDVGYGDCEITEMLGWVALFVFGDYLTGVAETEVDFPAAPELVVV